MATKIAGHGKAELIVGLGGTPSLRASAHGSENVAPLPVVRRNTLPAIRRSPRCPIPDDLEWAYLWIGTVIVALVLSFVFPDNEAAWRYWYDADPVRTCDDGTEIYQAPDASFVKFVTDSSNTRSVETVEDPATACN